MTTGCVLDLGVWTISNAHVCPVCPSLGLPVCVSLGMPRVEKWKISLSVSLSLPPSPPPSPWWDLWQEDRPHQYFPISLPASEALPLPHTNYLPGPNCWVGEVGGKESKMGTWGSVAQLRCTLRMDFPCTWPICSEQVALEATDPKSLVLPRGICPSAKTSPPCST